MIFDNNRFTSTSWARACIFHNLKAALQAELPAT